MRILAIDQSSTCCGFAVGDAYPDTHIPLLIQHGRIVSKHQNLINRLEEMRSGIHRLISLYKPDCMVMEDVYFHGLKSHKAIYAMVGAALTCETAAYHTGVKAEWINPQTIKGFFGAKDKNDIRMQVQRIFDLKAKQIFDDNHSDALGILVVAASQGQEATGE